MAISGMRPDLGRPAACLDSLAPLRTGQDGGIFKLVNDGVCRLVFSAHDPSLTAEIHDQLLPFITRNPKHARNLDQVWNVFLVVDFIEERLVLGITRYKREELVMNLGGERRIMRAENEPAYTVIYELENPGVLTSPDWGEAVEAGRWPAQVRPHTRNRRHVLLKTMGQAE